MARRPLYLESVRIDGFRSCEGTSFSPHRELSVLIGPNGSGKTNLLQGIALLAAWLTPTAASAERAGRTAAGDARVTAGFRSRDQAMALRSTVRVREAGDSPEAVLALKDEFQAATLADAKPRDWVELPLSFLLASDGARARSPTGKGPLDIPLTVPFMRFYVAHQAVAEQIAAFRRGIRYYSASQFTHPALCPLTLEVPSDEAPVGPPGAGQTHRQFLLDLYRSQTRAPAHYAAYVDLVGPHGLNLVSAFHWEEARPTGPSAGTRSRAPRRAASRTPLWIIPTVTRAGERRSFRQLSEGTLRALALVFYLLADDTELLLLEEPEIGVHRGLLTSLLEIIRSQSQRKQILISTHSDVVLDAVQPENVFAVTGNARGQTQVRALTESASAKEMVALRAYLHSEGSLGEYWRTFGLEG